MKISIVFLLVVAIIAVVSGSSISSEDIKPTSSIVINNGVTITGLDYKPDHPPHPFSNFERDAKCSGSCVCSGNKCSCSCYNCTNSQCLGGCIVTC